MKSNLVMGFDNKEMQPEIMVRVGFSYGVMDIISDQRIQHKWDIATSR
jgi:hypothetical protein